MFCLPGILIYDDPDGENAGDNYGIGESHQTFKMHIRI